ncbi:hypothetical protein SERLA73DRAFT_69774 [Serpula lacrymans var. lacrymans S7.3]|uniref:Rab-GAP TBC domain-containing protein n=2 Tax=Serpula lacrymans var. lacrymans TaxID=341189 RepID=F8PL60_SERL3|nr:uncharacterized protein SERLADRAFT_413191 [Serpula lacrymans var. lacrymans S7.9]EGO03968.1 hypothetical protein SERLA73DRAFT_69774 [Serpula lacrymans var. lacrymans S7.3]EGO29887.1 hypothetical protein SERLADRAFT_413191 [Serpula lacrymans var. lacrymans S7.9]
MSSISVQSASKFTSSGQPDSARVGDDELDWRKLRNQSLLPGGFGADRVSIWPKLLHVDTQSSNSPPGADISASRDSDDAGEDTTSVVVEPHEDERQIRLDTERSFVLYPVDHKGDRGRLQIYLYNLIVSVFRKRRRLHYFQGYHDIITVLFLTLPRELQLPCAEKLSLHRLRDSMGLTLEPVLGLLRILKNLIRLADPSLATILENTSPLPFYALPNLLTLFSHDTSTLPLIQHIFDYLLCRPPIAVVYLAAAVIMARKEQVEALQREGEDGMIHSLLNGLPELCEGIEDENRKSISTGPDITARNEIDSSLVDKPEATKEAPKAEEKVELPESTPNPLSDASTPNSLVDQEAIDGDQSRASGSPSAHDILPWSGPAHEGTHSAILPKDDIAMEHANNLNTAENGIGASSREEKPIHPIEKECIPTPEAEQPSESHENSQDRISDELHDEKHALLASPAASDADPDEYSQSPRKKRPPPIPLPSLLIHANQLFADYPPSHPLLAIPAIMGPRSVVHTWSEGHTVEKDDDEAEGWVGGEGIVLPYVEEEDEEDEVSELDSSGISSKSRSSKSKFSKDTKEKRSRRVLKKRRRFVIAGVEKRTMVAGAVLVLGVAMAVYGIRMGGVRHGNGHVGKVEWRRVKGWFMNAGERILDGFGGGFGFGFGVV